MSVSVMTAVWKHSKASGSGLLLLLAIADRCNDDGTGCWQGVESLAKKVRMSERSISRLIKSLEALGELEVSHRSSVYGTNEYKVTVPTGQIVMTTPVTGEDMTPVSGPDMTPVSSNTSVNTPVNTSEEQEHSVLPISAVREGIEEHFAELTKMKIPDRGSKRYEQNWWEGASSMARMADGDLELAIKTIDAIIGPFLDGTLNYKGPVSLVNMFSKEVVNVKEQMALVERITDEEGAVDAGAWL